MIHSEKEEKLRQIVSGFFHFKYKDRLLKYFEPTSSLFSEISFYTKNIESDLKRDGFLTEEDEKSILISRGLWSNEKEQELKTCQKDIEKLINEKPKLKFKSRSLQMVDSTINALQKRIEELSEVRHCMFAQTIEYQKAYRINVTLLSECVRDRFGEKIWKTVEELEEHISTRDIEELLKMTVLASKIQQKDIRAIARSEPWRTIWKTASKTGSSLFKNPISDITKAQYELCYWSNVYDSVYESPDFPGADVVDDDDKLDDWFVQQSSKYEKKSSPKSITTGSDAAEKFIMVETFEDAKKVYSELNSESSLAIIKQRTAAIEKNEMVAEAELPDIQKGLQVEINNMIYKQNR